jgi:lysophospholipase L1-like esterase
VNERPLVLLLGDSLVLPREFLNGTDRTTYDQTYVAQVKAILGDRFEFESIPSISLDSDDAVYYSKFVLEPRRPAAIVLHLGVNDCAPRLFRKGSRSVLLAPWFKRLTRNLVLRGVLRVKPWIFRRRRVVYVDEEEFERNMRTIIELVRKGRSNCAFLAIAISAKPDWMERRHPGYQEQVERYNAILARVFGEGFVDLNAIVPVERQLISDGIHLTPEAHAKLAEALSRRIEALTGVATRSGGSAGP